MLPSPSSPHCTTAQANVQALPCTRLLYSDPAGDKETQGNYSSSKYHPMLTRSQSSIESYCNLTPLKIIFAKNKQEAQSLRNIFPLPCSTSIYQLFDLRFCCCTNIYRIFCWGAVQLYWTLKLGACLTNARCQDWSNLMSAGEANYGSWEKWETLNWSIVNNYL